MQSEKFSLFGPTLSSGFPVMLISNISYQDAQHIFYSDAISLIPSAEHQILKVKTEAINKKFYVPASATREDFVLLEQYNGQ